jgi:hypothetical protein
MADVCTECGERVKPDATFCPSCLASIVSVAPTVAAAPVQAPPPPAQAPASQPAAFVQAPATQAPQRSVLPWIIGGVVGLLLLLGVGYRLMESKDVIDDTPPPVADAGSSAVGPEVAKYLISDANIRNLPTAKGPETKIVGTVQRGVQIKGAMHPATGGDGYWFKLSDGRGYISAVNLSDAPPVAAAANAAAAPQAAASPASAAPIVGGGTRAPVAGAPFCRVATRSGNLRIRSSANGPIIGGMPKGARFQAFNSAFDPAGAEWYQVQPFETRYPNGWVSADYIAC